MERPAATGFANQQPVADVHVGRHATNGKVFAKQAWRIVPVRLSRPPVVVIRAVSVHGLINPAVDTQVAYLITIQTQFSYQYRLAHRPLADSGGHRLVAMADRSNLADIHTG